MMAKNLSNNDYESTVRLVSVDVPLEDSTRCEICFLLFTTVFQVREHFNRVINMICFKNFTL
jgi:hypothetical protein